MSEQAEFRQGRIEGILEQAVIRLDTIEARLSSLGSAQRQDTAALGSAQRQDTAALRQEIADLGSAQRQDMAALEAAQRQDTAALRQEIVATNRRLDSHFRWLVGIQFGMVGLLVTILLKVL